MRIDRVSKATEESVAQTQGGRDRDAQAAQWWSDTASRRARSACDSPDDVE